MGGILSVYRNLRDNYEFRRRYDEAGKFFIREMELKRKYKSIYSDYKLDVPYKQKNWIERNISLIGLYFHLSIYEEDLLRPTRVGIAFVILSTLLFATQSNPSLTPTLPFSFLNHKENSSSIKYTIQPNAAITSMTSPVNKNFILVNSTTPNEYSIFIGIDKITDPIQLRKAFERSVTDFIPLLPSGSDIKIGLIDYIIKIVGGAVTFGLIAIALRRRFERKYYH